MRIPVVLRITARRLCQAAGPGTPACGRCGAAAAPGTGSVSCGACEAVLDYETLKGRSYFDILGTCVVKLLQRKKTKMAVAMPCIEGVCRIVAPNRS
jgi:hypothetical protein